MRKGELVTLIRILISQLEGFIRYKQGKKDRRERSYHLQIEHQLFVKGEILCERKTLGGEFSLLFSVLFLLVNKILSFLSHFTSWFLTKVEKQNNQALSVTPFHLSYWYSIDCVHVRLCMFVRETETLRHKKSQNKDNIS